VVATGSETPGRRLSRSRVPRLFGLALVGVAAALALSGCSVRSAVRFGWPDKLPTPQSHRMFDLWVGSVIAALAVGAFVWGLIFWCVIRYRKRSDELPAQTRYNLPIEILYTVTPFLIISVLFYYTAVIQTDVNRIRPNPDVTVQVDAFKWNWKFSYPGVAAPDGTNVSTVGADDYIPVLVLPVNERIRFVEHSNDVIHSFWVPDLLFKRDVFPGSVTNVWETTIEQTGSYVGHCAELCGTYHSMMNFEVRVVTAEQYQTFLKDRQSGMSTPEALQAIGQSPYATTTHPFKTKRDSHVAS
jgi:cytochrome c oxidase subunit II